jgi:hypothetical protein
VPPIRSSSSGGARAAGRTACRRPSLRRANRCRRQRPCPRRRDAAEDGTGGAVPGFKELFGTRAWSGSAESPGARRRLLVQYSIGRASSIRPSASSSALLAVAPLPPANMRYTARTKSACRRRTFRASHRSRHDGGLPSACGLPSTDSSAPVRPSSSSARWHWRRSPPPRHGPRLRPGWGAFATPALVASPTPNYWALAIPS